MIGERLKSLRKEKKMTQNSLAEYLNMTPTAIWKYEKELCDPDVDTLIKIADLFEVSIDYLVGRTDIRDFGDKKSTPDELAHDAIEARKAIADPQKPYDQTEQNESVLRELIRDELRKLLEK